MNGLHGIATDSIFTLSTHKYVCMLSWKMYVNLDKVYCLIIFPDILQVDKKIIY